MSSFKDHNSTEGRLPDRGKRYALWYYQDRGAGRAYFRLAPLGLALLLIPAVAAIAVLIVLFLHNVNTPIPKLDVTVKPLPTPANSPTQNIIRQTPPPPAPRPAKIVNQAQPPVLSRPTPSDGKDITLLPKPRPSPTATP